MRILNVSAQLTRPGFINYLTFSMLLTLALLVLSFRLSYADVNGPGWKTTQFGHVTPEHARAHYQALEQAQSSMRLQSEADSAAEASPEIKELARALQNDPKLIYEYVRNHVDYVPYFGSLKGAALTYLDGAGNDYDQASLMIALLRESNIDAQYIYGSMTIRAYGDPDNKDVQHWLGTDASDTVIGQILSNGGIPYSQQSPNLSITRVWVSATINGQTYQFDPAFKSYREIQGINLSSAMGYSNADLLTAAGGVSGTDYVQNLNESNIQSQLTAYAANLHQYLKANYPNATMEEIIGGRQIIPEYLTGFSASLSGMTPLAYWDEIPSSYIHTVRIEHGQIDKTLNINELSGKRLSLTYKSADADTTAAAQSSLQSLQSSPASENIILPQKTEVPTVSIAAGTYETESEDTSTWDFGKTYPNGYTSRTTELINSNSSTITIVVSLASNPQNAYSFETGGGSHDLAPDSSLAIELRLNGSGQSAGTKTGQLRIECWHNSNNFATNIINLTGEVAHELQLSGYGMNVTSYLDQSLSGTCRIQNDGSLPLTINSMTITGSDASHFEFVSGNESGTIASGAFRDIQVEYLANSVGNHDAAITLTLTYDSLSYSPVTLGLAGETLATPLAQLWLDDTLLEEETEILAGQDMDTLVITVNHPYAAASDTEEEPPKYTVKRGAYYTIIYDFGASQEGGVVEKRQRQMTEYRQEGKSDTSREVVTETLNVMGMTWMRDTALNKSLLAEIAGVVSLYHHRFGIVAQEEGYYIDVKDQLNSIVSRHGDTTAQDAYFKATNHMASALEHGVLEQMQMDRPAVSTVKLLQIANSSGNKVFEVTSANYDSIESQLQNYSDQDLSSFEQAVDNNSTLFLPADGNIPLLSWSGKGYIRFTTTETWKSCGMIIGGDYNGGYGAVEALVDVAQAHEEVVEATRPSATDSKVPSEDPVDMTTGHFMYSNTDLSLSGGMGGISFKREYFGENHHTDNGLGYGWSHNLDLAAKVFSSSGMGLGQRLPLDAVGLLAVSVATLDLMTDDTGVKEWMTAALVAKWGMDTLIDNAVSIHIDTDSLTYVKLPDGSYSPPPGITSELVLENGAYCLNERFDRFVRFNTDRKVSTITDADGNSTTFTYSNGKLHSVSDGFGHTLTFSYTDDLLNSVSDNAGRSVSFGYTDNDLDTYTDPAGKVWHYGYDDGHRLVTLKNPEQITTVTNTYDSLGRVKCQTVPRQTGTATYNLYFGGYRNVEEDSEGNQTIYYYDGKKRLTETEDALGRKTVHSYDGQNHIVETTDPGGNLTRYVYDGNNNLTSVINALDEETRYVYDDDFRLDHEIDPLGNMVQYVYDDEHHLETLRGWPESDSPIETFTTYYPNGQVHTKTDGNGVVTTYAYDVLGNPDTVATADYPAIDYGYDTAGRMVSLTNQEGAITRFDFDNRGLLQTRTDPLMKTSQFTYYADGRIHTRTDRNNRVLTYTYTPSGKVETITFDSSQTPVTYTYDARDNLTQIHDQTGATTYTYYKDNRVKTITGPHGITITCQYDAAGNLESLTYPGNRTVT